MSDPQQPRKDPKLIASAVLVGLIVVAGTVFVGMRAFSGDDDPTPTPPSESATTSTSDASSACGLPDGDQSVPTSAPTTTWYLNGTLVSPKSKQYGPAKVSSSIHSCFARSPLGAVFASANAAADIANAKVDKKMFLETRAARTAGYAQALAALGNDDEGSGGGVQFAGFRVDSSISDAATVQLVVVATEGPTNGGFTAITYNVVWKSGDWQIVIPEDGVPVSSSVNSLDGYIPWSGS